MNGSRCRVLLGAAAVAFALAMTAGACATESGHQLADRIGARTTTERTAPFRSIPSVDSPLRLAVAGDVGTGGEDEQRTAMAMDLMEGEREYDALLLLGDNVYPHGDPAELDRTVFVPFAGVLDGSTRLLAVVGNHDVEQGHGDASAAAIGMPARWYAQRLGDVMILALDSTQPDNPEQLTWLESTLASNTAPWTIAMMHHPPYSGGAHGSSQDVRQAFAPVFEQYGVDLVLAGHDHDYQRSRQIRGVTYIVSGGAATLRPANLASFSEFAASTFHFVDIELRANHLEVRAVDQDGKTFDEVTLTH